MSMYYTGDSATPKPDTFVMRFDNQQWLLEAIYAALNTLAKPENWEQAGDITPEQAAAFGGYIVQYFDPAVEMIGMILPFAGKVEAIPAGALFCDGAAYLRTSYPLLYQKMPASFIVDADTFTVPDMRGQFLVGVNSDDYLGQKVDFSEYPDHGIGGAEKITLTTAQMPIHAHTDAGHTHGYIPALPNATTIGVGLPQPTAIPGAAATAPGFASIQATGGDQAHENRPPFYALAYLIIAE